MPTNCYVLSGGDIAVIVDPGGGYGKINAYLETSALNVKAVVLTHGHFDHIADVFKWHRDGVPVYIHSEDASCLYSAEDSLASMVGLTIPSVRDYYTFSDGDELRFGEITMRVIHTPGHTKGSCSFELPGGVLLTGDTLFCDSYGRTDFPGGSTEQMRDSLVNKLFAIEGDRIVYPGHGDSTTLKNERQFNPILSV